MGQLTSCIRIRKTKLASLLLHVCSLTPRPHPIFEGKKRLVVVWPWDEVLVFQNMGVAWGPQGWAPKWLCLLLGLGLPEKAMGWLPLRFGIGSRR